MVRNTKLVNDKLNFLLCFNHKQSGDSGGPLLIRQSDGRWIVLGITSYGSVTTASMAPGVYVKLAAHEKWLESYITNER